MSRSYRKFLSWESSEFDPINWPGIRVKERGCINDELKSIEYGNILFPRHYGSSRGSWRTSSRYYYSIKEIRNDYYTGIRNIISGYKEKHIFIGPRKKRVWLRDDDYEQNFLENFYMIRKGERSYIIDPCLEWLTTREVKRTIKSWNGDPINALYYMIHSGIIERAIRFKCKEMLRK